MISSTKKHYNIYLRSCNDNNNNAKNSRPRLRIIVEVASFIFFEIVKFAGRYWLVINSND
jgi:hypothetical protein